MRRSEERGCSKHDHNPRSHPVQLDPRKVEDEWEREGRV